MKRGDIWLVGLDPTPPALSASRPGGNLGHEQRGRRPVLIVSPDAFNRLTQVPVVVPITSGGSFARTAGFAVQLTGSGTRTVGVARCDQPRAVDLGARGATILESVPDFIMDEVLAKLAPIFE